MERRSAGKKHWRRHWIAVGLLCLLILTLMGTVRFILRRTAWITLPTEGGVVSPDVTSPVREGTGQLSVQITPHTVRSAVATLSRLPSYSRTVRITQFWDAGRGSYEANVSVSGGWTRIDLEQTGGTVRHTLTDGVQTYIWQGEDAPVFHGPAEGITADNEQHIPTYEDVLALEEDQILRADFQDLQGERCIYVEAAEGDYLRRYWISVESGLLSAAEMLEQETIIYRMESSAVGEPEEDSFLLPDGTDVRTLPETENAPSQ